MSKPRRILQRLYYTGTMPGPYHYIRSRMIRVPSVHQLRLLAAYVQDRHGNWCRASSSIHCGINRRAGLDRDFMPAVPRDSDVIR